MSTKDLLDKKKVLIVDDEPDIPATLEELLPMCVTTKAFTFEEAANLIEKQHFDLAILDIMGVRGYELLRKAVQKNVIVVILTAHALNAEDLKKSYNQGAASYIPKEELINIATYLNDILEAREKGKSFWWRWLDRMEGYFDQKFGPEWQERHQIKIR
jgi:CheY-like chemotaxis protein